MWIDFLYAACSAVVFLFIPGGLVAYSLRRSLLEGVALGPILAVVFYSIGAIVYDRIGIASSWLSLFVPFFVISALVFFVRMHFVSGKADRRCLKRDAGLIVLYTAVGVVVVGCFFVKNLDGAGSLFQSYDNGAHLSAIRAFVDTGDFSSFSGGEDRSLVSAFTSSASSFYPSAWYCLVAMCVTAMGSEITVAVNAVNAVCAGLVFPLSALFAATKIFNPRKRTLVLGSFFIVAVAPFPWGFLTFGPLYPNLLSMCLFPAAVAYSVCFLRFDSGRSERIASFVFAAVSVIALLFAQPNSIFAELVVLIPFFAFECAGRFTDSSNCFTGKSLIAFFASFALMALAWFALYSLPISIIRSVADFNWPATATKWQAFVDCLLYSFNTGAAQLLLAALILVGAVKMLSSARTAWLPFAYAFSCLIYISSVSSESFLKHILSGFWYTDPYRLAATAAVISLPLIVAGASWLVDVLVRWLKRGQVTGFAGSIKPACCVLAAVVCVALFGPNYVIAGFGSVTTGFGNIATKVNEQNSTSVDNVLTLEESQFAQEALALVPEGDIVLNEPNDGSAFLYGLFDSKNVLYKRFALPGDGEKPESAIIRAKLDEVATNSDVASAVESFNAKYVLLLDQGGDPDDRITFWSYYPEQWEGFSRITDSTPGFEIVLAKDDMRLYKIVA